MMYSEEGLWYDLDCGSSKYYICEYPLNVSKYRRLKRPSHTAAITKKMITITTQRECSILVELLHTEYAHAHSTNGMRSLCVVIVLVIAAVGPGL